MLHSSEPGSRLAEEPAAAHSETNPAARPSPFSAASLYRPGGAEQQIIEHLPEPAVWLAGEDAPLPRKGFLAVFDGLLRLPANLMHDLRARPITLLWLLALMLGATALTGFSVGAFSGGAQLWIVPLKLSLGLSFCAVICLPSLYIFTCLSGGEQGLQETSGALLAGVALTALLLVGFAPVSWVFSQATDSTVLVGGLHLFFFLISVHFGLRLTRRSLAHLGRRPVPALGLWSVVFVLVVLQMSTTLRPLVGPFDGLELADKQFFLVHWFS